MPEATQGWGAAFSCRAPELEDFIICWGTRGHNAALLISSYIVGFFVGEIAQFLACEVNLQLANMIKYTIFYFIFYAVMSSIRGKM